MRRACTIKKMILAAIALLVLFAALSPAYAATEEARSDFELPENAARYAAYAEENPEMDWEEVLVRVNLRLDYANYEGILYAQNPSSTLVFVNKHYKLPLSYKPTDLVTVDSHYSSKTVQLRSVCYDAFLRMAQDIEAEGLTLFISSGYRMNRKRGGPNDRWYAWPGHSEHQTGLAFDLRKRGPTLALLGDYEYEKTAEFAWLCENAHRYGFINSYPKDTTNITGFGFEPWHWRYVGVTVATEMFEQGIATYHEYWASHLIRFARYAEEESAPFTRDLILSLRRRAIPRQPQVLET